MGAADRGKSNCKTPAVERTVLLLLLLCLTSTPPWQYGMVPVVAAALPSMDLGVGAFSPDGSLYQLDYAKCAAARGALAVGVEAQGAVVLVCERRSSLSQKDGSSVGNASDRSDDGGSDVDGSNNEEDADKTTTLHRLMRHESVTNRKILPLSPSLGCSAAGIPPDSRALVDRGRRIIQEHWFVYGEAPSVEFVAAEMGTAALSFSNHPRQGDSEEPAVRIARPFGVSLLLAGVDGAFYSAAGDDASFSKKLAGSAASSGDEATEELPGSLFYLEPTGAYSRWRGKAIGRGAGAAEAEIAHLLAASNLVTNDRPLDGDAAVASPHVSKLRVLPVRDALQVAVRALLKGLKEDGLEEDALGAVGTEVQENSEDDGDLNIPVPPNTASRIEVAIVRHESRGGFRIISDKEVREMLERAQ